MTESTVLWTRRAGRLFPRGLRVAIVTAWGVLAGVASMSASSQPIVWGGMLVSTGDDSILTVTEELQSTLNGRFVEAGAAAHMGEADARDALLRGDAVVLLGVITLVDRREERFHVPLSSAGETLDLYYGQLIVGGTVVAFLPITGTVLETEPVFGVRHLRLRSPPSEERLRQETVQAASAFAGAAGVRARMLGDRTEEAAVRKPLIGSPYIEASAANGLRPGVAVLTKGASGATIHCVVSKLGKGRSTLACPEDPRGNASGSFLRSTGVGARRHQVDGVSITSEKGRKFLDGSVDACEEMLAFAASDELAGLGRTVLPPSGGQGLRLIDRALYDFSFRYGLADSEVEKYTVRFPPPEVQVKVVLDGYNSKVVLETGVIRVRAHKAWAQVSDRKGRQGKGIGVERVDEIEGWQEVAPQAADARQAMIRAVRCAVRAYVGESGEECQ